MMDVYTMQTSKARAVFSSTVTVMTTITACSGCALNSRTPISSSGTTSARTIRAIFFVSIMRIPAAIFTTTWFSSHLTFHQESLMSVEMRTRRTIFTIISFTTSVPRPPTIGAMPNAPLPTMSFTDFIPIPSLMTPAK